MHGHVGLPPIRVSKNFVTAGLSNLDKPGAEQTCEDLTSRVRHPKPRRGRPRSLFPSEQVHCGFAAQRPRLQLAHGQRLKPPRYLAHALLGQAWGYERSKTLQSLAL